MARLLVLSASVLAAALSLTSGSGALASASSSGPRLHLPIGSLHKAYEAALHHTAATRIGGIVPSRAAGHKGSTGSAGTSKAAPAVCAEPNCDLTYNNGPVQHSPQVYVVFWGSAWNTVPAETAVSNELIQFYSGLGTSQDTWSTVTSQYGDGSGNPTFSGAAFANAFVDTSSEPDPVTENELAAEATAAANHLGVTDLANAQIVVASASGTCFSDGFVGSCGSVSSNPSGYCAWHSMTNTGVPFVNLPYALDAGIYCGENWINGGTNGQYDGVTTLAGHEYAETISDPDVGSGWIDAADSLSGGEIADKCAWGGSNWGQLGSDPYGNITLSTGTFAMQSLWSNTDGSCVMSSAFSLTVTQPRTQSSTLGSSVVLQVKAATNAGVLTYRATRLPFGLSINSSTGRITGKPGTTAGTFKPRITVSDDAESSTVTFTWKVSSKAGPVKGYLRRCVDDYLGHTRNGTKIDLWSCDGQSRQRITFAANGELKVLGKCITSGRGIVLQACRDSSSQKWTRRGNGEYVLGGRCLTDPGRSRRNGTQLRMAACSAASNQRWSLP